MLRKALAAPLRQTTNRARTRCSWYLLAFVLLVIDVRAQSSLETCSDNLGIVVIDAIELSPAVPRTNQEVELQVLGRISHDAQAPLNATSLTAVATIHICRRYQDCMSLTERRLPVCPLLDEGTACSDMQPGERFSSTVSALLPSGTLRGTYRLTVEVLAPPGTHLACYELDTIIVLSNDLMTTFNDYRDAFVAFAIAASSAYALGTLFPTLSGGLLPQISGFLCIGILVGPYCTNLVSHMHIFMIGGWINKVSLSFIGGAAGAEIFLPEFRALLRPLGLQVGLITVATLVLCTVVLLALSDYHIVSMPALEVQPNLRAKAAVCLLAAAMMTARSPASAIAVIAELECAESDAAKMALGITVLSDIVVLILFSLCQQLVRIATRGGVLGVGVFLGALTEVGASVLLGVAAGQALRFVLRLGVQDARKEEGDTWAPVCVEEKAMGDNLDLPDNGGVSEAEQHHPTSSPRSLGFPRPVKGILVLLVLTTTFVVAEEAAEWTGEHLRVEPLLACVVASCLCGHDSKRRTCLLEALSFWTAIVLLPFFTLAGASLQLPGLAKVLPAAVALVALRTLSNALGSAGAAMLSEKYFHEARTTPATVQFTWMTLLAQAGVTLGLVLGLQSQPCFKKWSRQFGVLVLGVVMLNQMIGPVLCRVGIQKILVAEVAAKQEEESGHSSEDPLSSPRNITRAHSQRLSSGSPRHRGSSNPYDTLLRPGTRGDPDWTSRGDPDWNSGL